MVANGYSSYMRGRLVVRKLSLSTALPSHIKVMAYLSGRWPHTCLSQKARRGGSRKAYVLHLGTGRCTYHRVWPEHPVGWTCLWFLWVGGGGGFIWCSISLGLSGYTGSHGLVRRRKSVRCNAELEKPPAAMPPVLC